MNARQYLRALGFACFLGLAMLAVVSRANAQFVLALEGIDLSVAAELGEIGAADEVGVSVVDSEGQTFRLAGRWSGDKFITRDGRTYEEVRDATKNELVLKPEFQISNLSNNSSLALRVVPRADCNIPFVPPARSPYFCTTSTPEQVEACRREANQIYAEKVASSRQEWQRRRLECQAKEGQQDPELPPISATPPAKETMVAYGQYCATPVGLFGPGPSSPIGSGCRASDPTGTYFGTVSSGVGPNGTAAYGEYCQTSVGIRGPGPTNLVGTRCHSTDQTGTHYGTVTARAPELGQYCATQIGIVGPGASNPVGSPCTGRTPQGVFRGTVVSHR